MMEKVINSLSPPPYLGTDSGLYSEVCLRLQVLHFRFLSLLSIDITHRMLSGVRGERAV